jgi:hypothetical protein
MRLGAGFVGRFTARFFDVENDVQVDDFDERFKLVDLGSGGFLSHRRGRVREPGYDDIEPVLRRALSGVVFWSRLYSSSGAGCTTEVHDDRAVVQCLNCHLRRLRSLNFVVPMMALSGSLRVCLIPGTPLSGNPILASHIFGIAGETLENAPERHYPITDLRRTSSRL